MPKLQVKNLDNKIVGEIELSESVFAAKVNKSLLFAAVKHYLDGLRQGTHATKTRSQVSGGGKKPWRQKGTGRARVGSSRNPIWRHGGVAHVGQDVVDLVLQRLERRLERVQRLRGRVGQTRLVERLADGPERVVDLAHDRYRPILPAAGPSRDRRGTRRAPSGSPRSDPTRPGAVRSHACAPEIA